MTKSTLGQLKAILFVSFLFFCSLRLIENLEKNMFYPETDNYIIQNKKIT
jgi:hypothetical protein